MKRTSIILSIVTIAATVFAAIPTRYYVGKFEVPESFWNQMPDSLDYATSEFDYDTLLIKTRELPYTHYIDSVSTPGNYVITKRSPAVIAELERMAGIVRSDVSKHSLSISVGDSASQISIVRYKDKSLVDSLFVPGHCYLLSFWATWCGNCLYELQPEFIPSVTESFSNNPCFHFVPVCIDSTHDDLQKFFSNEPGCKWSYLSDITYLDTDRKANEKFGESGIMPLNIVVGKDGLIHYIHSGAIKDEAALSALSDAIEAGL